MTRSFFGAVADVAPRHTFVVTPSAERYPVGERMEVIGLGELLRSLREFVLA